VTTEGGRLRPDDMYTIKTVMSSITLPDGKTPEQNTYSVIINKCEFLDNPAFTNGGKAKIESLLNNTKTNPVPTAYIKFLAAQPELAGASNQRVTFEGLFAWIFAATPSIRVAKAEQIDTSSQEEIIEAMRKEHEQALQHLEQLSQKQAEELAAASEARKQMEAEMKEKIQKMEEDAARRAKEASEEMARQREEAEERERRSKKEHDDKMAAIQKEMERREEQLRTASKETEAATKRMLAEQKAQAEKERQQREVEHKRKMEELQRREQDAKDAAAAKGGGLMGAYVDLTTLISKPIVKAFSKQTGEDFNRTWNKELAKVKQWCFF